MVSFCLQSSIITTGFHLFHLWYDTISHNFVIQLIGLYKCDFSSVLSFFFSSFCDFLSCLLSYSVLKVALLAGTKLQVIITKMCVDSCKENPVIKGSLLVTPSDAHFWFHRPEWLLHLIKFILIQVDIVTNILNTIDKNITCIHHNQPSSNSLK